nr:PAS domain-containing protein [Tessaracoccus coleopterorum]
MDLTSATSESTFPDPDSSPDQDINPDQDIKSYALDAQWRRAVMESISDGLLLLDPTGLVLDMNQAFVDLFGYPLEEGPYHPPYPWWPTEEEDGDTLHDLECFFEEICQGVAPERDFPFLTRDRARIWVHTTGTAIHHGSLGTTHLRIVRDITRQREAQRRRAAAVDVSHGFAVVDDLEDLIGIAEHGFALLFDGECTIRLGGAEGPTGSMPPGWGQ